MAEKKAEVAVPDRMAQKDMHKSFFDKCQNAIDNSFYMEAILMEYAAIEARLEVILGLLGLPCSQFIPDEDRRTISISHRVKCLKKIRKNSTEFEKSKLSCKYFDKLDKWIKDRNGYVHGLYKNEIKYKDRIKGAKKTAEDGFNLCKQLYREANRIRRLIKKRNYADMGDVYCYERGCRFYFEKKGDQEV